MLPKAERLSRDRDIKAVLRARQYENRGPLLRLTARDSQRETTRLVIVTPGRIGNAVIRNRLRRVFVAAYCKIRHNFAKNVDFVVFPGQSSVGLSVERIARELFSALRRLRIVDNVKYS